MLVAPTESDASRCSLWDCPSQYGVDMDLAGRITVGAAVLVVGGLVALAAPAVASAAGIVSAWAHTAPTEDPPEAESPADGDAALEKDMLDELSDGYVYVGNGTAIPKNGPAGCEEPRWLHVGGGRASINGDLIDRGVNDLARGAVGLDADGDVKTYTVEPGDALYAIADRFCIANALAISTLNHTRTIQPGEVLLLAPDRSIPWVEYFNPRSAGAGYQQIPYQLAVEAMSAAAWAGDLERMRAIFTNELRGLYPDPAEADVIARALDAGDLDALRQMFA
ncbi:hypothetical protein R8Z57_11810 [Microbacterium sp. M3]|uniref:LysM domain-containing protein n=1 Tax=Microbacterium arthrosphaerae TaxID=792652 RepID=A0ABU4H298_9MICO|nr:MULTISPECIES: hypothetical protein [Microbacterium]MDW4573458.1 hypothetical protein [Microbacterium arthrosphaerae]MDW7607313.1 hypothetical protein [Microbacterium sp. M3]